MDANPHLIAYDIADPRRLRRVERLLAAVSQRVHFSLFVVDIAPAQLQRQFEQRLNVARRHPQSGEPLDVRRIMDAQIRALAHTYRHPLVASYKACTFR